MGHDHDQQHNEHGAHAASAHGHDHEHHDAAVDHEVKAIMREKLHPFYDVHREPLLQRSITWLKHKFIHVPINIDTSSYQHPTLDQFNENQIVQRTVFALQKIKAFNHHFFAPEEQRTLNPIPYGIGSFIMHFGFIGTNALILTYLWKNWSFNARSVTFFAAFLGLQYALNRVPNYLNEMVIQAPKRKVLAQKYLTVYGAEFFHNVCDPRFDLQQLSHLHNRLG